MNVYRKAMAARPAGASGARLLRAMALSLCMALPFALHTAQAANNDGALAGRLTSADQKSLEGVEVTVRNPDTGFVRTVKPDAEGNYRFPYLPVGLYALEATRADETVGKLGEVNISVGNTTIANIEVAGTALDTVTVLSSRINNKVDVTSTESATNISIEELRRLPVQRDVVDVALLAPGLNKGDDDLVDGVATISFGGSSAAENTAYINGLNVTDFYNRIGFSNVPFSFYKDFQIKTGGYSVEFGRTTGGVINAVTRSGTNQFDFGSEIVWEPHALQTEKTDRRYSNGTPRIIARNDYYDRTSANFYASGPIVKDKLFFFALYEARQYEPQNTNDQGSLLFKSDNDDAFWGAKLDWQISDKHLLELLAFSDDNQEVEQTYRFDEPTDEQQARINEQFVNTGGENWALTYSAYFADNFVMKAMYGENDRSFARFSNNDLACNRIRDLRTGGLGQGDVGCTTTPSRTLRGDLREAGRLDFEWMLGDHQLRFGLDHESNTSDHTQFYPGENRLLYEIRSTTGGATLENGGVVPPGVTAYVRTRQNEVEGTFESINSAYYLEDNWSITPNFILNAGLRLEGFDNRNGDGDTYIKIDDMLAPRFGFSWDMKGDARMKLFGNLGRYYLPVANVINIKQAGGFLDERTFYVFDGFEEFEYNGQTFQRPILGAQIGSVDNSQGDGTVGDLRGEVDQDIDPVYQDEVILGFQQMITDAWSWGVRGIYRKLTNAIDDMEITSTGIICGGEPVGAGFVMGNPGEDLTIFTDTDCDGENDGFVTIDTSRAGWAMLDDGENYVGEAGYPEPRRTYRAIELVLDRAWDKVWSLNASYTLSYSRGNAEGPVNSDTNFADAGRTEAFDNPWVNFGGYGDLPNDRRHQLKVRGAYAISPSWELGATLNVASGRPINAFGVGNPFDGTNFHSYFICVENCSGLDPDTGDEWLPSQRTYVESPRGAGGRTPWTYDVGASLTYARSFSAADLQVKLAVYNLLNQERATEASEFLETDIGFINDGWGEAVDYQSPRYAFLSLSLEF